MSVLCNRLNSSCRFAKRFRYGIRSEEDDAHFSSNASDAFQQDDSVQCLRVMGSLLYSIFRQPDLNSCSCYVRAAQNPSWNWQGANSIERSVVSTGGANGDSSGAMWAVLPTMTHKASSMKKSRTDFGGPGAAAATQQGQRSSREGDVVSNTSAS